MRAPFAGVWHRLGAFLLPAVCALCALPAEPATGLCTACRAERQPADTRPLAPLAALGVRVHAAFDYDEPLAALVQRYKFHGDLAAGRTLARLALPTLHNAPRPDALVPVPLHRSRLRERGHDQALGLACDWGRALGLPVARGVLARSRATRPQTQLDAEARRANPVGAFHASRRCPARIALVDDVLTTGSTLAAAAEALQAAGAAEVQAWVVARAARHGPV